MYDYIQFYSSHGVENLKKEGSQYKGYCCFHDDKGSKVKGFSVNPSSGLWKCFSCDIGGNVIDFCKRKNIPLTEAPDYDPDYRSYTYTHGTKKRHNTIKSKITWEDHQKDEKTPYNVEDIEEARSTGRRLWICEGEKDAETMHSVGELAIATPSASDLGGIDKIDFKGIDKIIIAFDHDDTGRKATDKVSALIPWADVIHFPSEKPEHYDLTDCYEEGGAEGFLETLSLWTGTVEDEPPLTEYLKRKLELSQTRDPNEPIGYRLTKFKRLQENIDGIQSGFYLVGADTSIGKTSFCVNLFLDALATNEELTGIYFSLDDNKDVVINRILAIHSGIAINKIQKRIDSDRELKALLQASSWLREISEKRRLFIYDQSDINDTKDVERNIRRRLNKPLFVVVDGLFNLDVEENTDGIREKNIARANELKRLVDVYRIPVVCTAELRKSKQGSEGSIPTVDSIMETGKFKYNANLILLLYPDDINAYDQYEEATVAIKYAKNKLSHYRGTDTVTFHRTYSGMDDMKRKE